MSVSINLLPDIRQARLRDEHQRRVTTALSVLVWIIAAGIVVVLFLLIGAQKLRLTSVNNEIGDRTSQVNAVANINDALTAQQALATLPSLYEQRTYYSQFIDRVAKLTPTDIHIASLSTDATDLLTVSGTASSAASVDKFFEALQAANTDDPYVTGLALHEISKDGTGKTTFSLTGTLSPSATAGGTNG